MRKLINRLREVFSRRSIPEVTSGDKEALSLLSSFDHDRDKVELLTSPDAVVREYRVKRFYKNKNHSSKVIWHISVSEDVTNTAKDYAMFTKPDSEVVRTVLGNYIESTLINLMEG